MQKLKEKREVKLNLTTPGNEPANIIRMAIMCAR